MARRRNLHAHRPRGRQNPLGTLFKRVLVIGLVGVAGWWVATELIWSASAEPSEGENPAQADVAAASTTGHSAAASAQQRAAQALRRREQAQTAYQALWDSLPSLTGDDRVSQLIATRAALDSVLQCAMPLEQRRGLIEQLDTLNAELTFSPLRHPLTDEHVVVSGDTLSSIAANCGQGMQLIADMNHLPDDFGFVPQGGHLKILQGTCRVVVSKSNFTLNLYCGEQLLKQFVISTGLNNATPEGDFIISNRVQQPVFHHPELGDLAYGDPNNPLGEWWLGFQGEYRSYGIHGTLEPEKLGQPASQGCIRMSNEDVTAFKYLVIVGTPVQIVP